MKNNLYEFYKEKPGNKIWNVDHYILKENPTEIIENDYELVIGELLFSFNKKDILNLWIDYPNNFSADQKALFDKENPYWAEFFKDRK